MKKKIQTTHTRRELTTEELQSICTIATGEMRTLFAIGIYSGLRLGDCCSIRWSNIDLARNIIMVVPRKTSRRSNGKAVLIPIHADLRKVLEETDRNSIDGYILPTLHAMYESEPSIVTARIKKVFRQAGIVTTINLHDGTRARPEATFHSLRHTFVSLCAANNMPLYLVQEIVGHSNPAMTRHYLHTNPTALTKAISQLPAIISNKL